MKITAAGKTDMGRIRKNNEDNFIIGNLNSGKTAPSIDKPVDLTDGVLLIVADGMGGAAAGEVAAEVVVEKTFDHVFKNKWLDPGKMLVNAIYEAHAAINSIVKETPEKRGMGAVATILFMTDKHHCVAQVGDTRLYLLRDNNMDLLTADQTLVAEMVRSMRLTPEQARLHPLRNQVNQAIGPSENLTPEISYFDFRAGDRILLCSDGLNGMVVDELIQEKLVSVKEPLAAATALINLANECGGYDNTTVVVADFH